MLKRLNLFCALLALGVMFGCGDSGDSPPMGPGGPPNKVLTSSKDNTLYEDATGQWSNGSGQFMFAGQTQMSGGSGEPVEKRRAVFAFDIAAAGIPAGSTIDSVRLELTMTRTISGVATLSLHRLTADWGEAGSLASGQEGGGAMAEAGDATWVHTFAPATMWTIPGGDFIGTASAARTVSGLATYTWGSTAQMVGDVQGWFDTPATNFGWILIGDESNPATAKQFGTRNNQNAARRPKLTIYYAAP